MMSSFRCEPSADVCDRLLRRVAERDRIAFRGLYRQLVRAVFRQVGEELGNTASAVAVTKAVFVEVWSRAPVHAAGHGAEAIGWVRAIAARRAAERSMIDALRSAPDDHDARAGRELTAALDGGELTVTLDDAEFAGARTRVGRWAGCGRHRPHGEPRT
ncbi:MULTISPECIES: sigma-70 family RNA polymerase sigma factor [Catenuloplanes]|uniref:RNA polymerase sigma-70 factor (ECF subfamily) n=1 Tax=Catenuloplanes niger TaxID=587534 RepID=A0AAE3ZPK9_9ACTN|nr:hypothetical protein [Catenuloplanes niger]MDR7322599.1 RNA polymerase sigma-70 factor (ECF subfamily) [Catenuloplanes niger]